MFCVLIVLSFLYFFLIGFLNVLCLFLFIVLFVVLFGGCLACFGVCCWLFVV